MADDRVPSKMEVGLEVEAGGRCPRGRLPIGPLSSVPPLTPPCRTSRNCSRFRLKSVPSESIQALPDWSARLQIILQVLSNLDPTDASRFFVTCRDANAFASSFTLNKQLFLNLFDPPPAAPEGEVFPYAERLRARVRARGWLTSTLTIETLAGSADLESTLESLVEIAESRSASSTHLSRNQEFLETHVDEHAVDELSHRRKGGHALRKAHDGMAPSSRVVQLSARLHALHSPTPHAAGSPFVRTAAREVVYAQSEWLRSSNWGPFVTGTGGRKSAKGLVVDWHKLTALAVVMATNLRELEGTGWGGDDVEIPQGWDSTRPGEVPEGRDWAGVEEQVSFARSAVVELEGGQS